MLIEFPPYSTHLHLFLLTIVYASGFYAGTVAF